jgi:hypothetical protein
MICVLQPGERQIERLPEMALRRQISDASRSASTFVSLATRLRHGLRHSPFGEQYFPGIGQTQTTMYPSAGSALSLSRDRQRGGARPKSATGDMKRHR